jgi:hypothetical protein
MEEGRGMKIPSRLYDRPPLGAMKPENGYQPSYRSWSGWERQVKRLRLDLVKTSRPSRSDDNHEV